MQASDEGRQDSSSIGVLYLVSTPIGNLEDITHRAVRILREVDLVAAEDTRKTSVLLGHFGIRAKRLVSLHEHNEEQKLASIVEDLCAGSNAALVSDAGTPAISDPGYRLVNAAIAAGARVEPVPGACAAVAALTASGLATVRFEFLGFVPRQSGRRQELFGRLRQSPATLIFYEAPGRVAETLQDVVRALGGTRRVVVARELTKLYEEFVRGTAQELAERFADVPPRGECTIVVEGASDADGELVDLEAEVGALLEQGFGPKEVAQRLVAITGVPRRRIYQLALALRKSQGNS